MSVLISWTTVCKSPTFTAFFKSSPVTSSNFWPPKPLATSVICLSPALIPFLVTLGPPTMVRPSLLIVVSPTVTEPFLPSMVTAVSPLPTVTTSAKPTVTSLPVLLTTTLPSPFILTVSPGLTLLAVPESVAMFQPALATLETSFNWLTLTASVSATPAAKLVILSPPMLMPLLLMVGPPLITMLFKSVKSFAITKFSLPSAESTRRFAPVESAVAANLPEMVKVSPSFLAIGSPLSPAKVNGVFAIFATAFNWLTFTASSSAVPAATLVIWRPPTSTAAWVEVVAAIAAASAAFAPVGT